MNRFVTALGLSLASAVCGQEAGDGCNSALDTLNRLKEKFYANAESTDFKLAYSNLMTATRNCPESGEMWYFRALLGRKGGAPERDFDYSLKKARALGFERSEGSSSPADVAALKAPVGNKWALVIGVGKFQDSRLRALKFPPADATAIRDVLIDPAIGKFPSANVQLLTDDEAKLGRIREGIGWLRQQAKSNDLVLVYLASHGLPRDEDPNGVSYIATYDSSLDNAAKRYSSSLQMVDLVNDLTRELQSLRLILILDTCYSGDAGSGAVAATQVSQMASFSEALRLFQSGAGRVVLTAASADQRSYESESFGHGYFTHFLLQALKESAGQATVGELYDKVRPATEAAVKKDLGKAQTPVIIAGSAAKGIAIGTAPGQ